jgi:hypothetical protein
MAVQTGSCAAADCHPQRRGAPQASPTPGYWIATDCCRSYSERFMVT